MKNWATAEADVNMILTKHFTAGRNGRKIKYIVVHHNAGRLSVQGCYNVWQTRRASAHYQVEAGGRIGQLVWDRDTAWHAANSVANQESIGIEHANSSTPTSPITEATLDNGAHLVAALCLLHKLGRPQWNVNVFPHKKWTATSCPGHIAGSQNAAYMARAQHWYDAMAKPAAGTKPPQGDEIDMATLKELRQIVREEVDRRCGDVVPAPSGYSKIKTNPTWVLSNAVGELLERDQKVRAEQASQRKLLEALAKKILTTDEIREAAEAGAKAALDERIAGAEVTLTVEG